MTMITSQCIITSEWSTLPDATVGDGEGGVIPTHSHHTTSIITVRLREEGRGREGGREGGRERGKQGEGKIGVGRSRFRG